MQPRLLIINCPSEYFAYVPVGTFGLCDYLSRRNIHVKILNLALYEEDKVFNVLKHYLEQFRPTHAGLILHWQDTADGFLRTIGCIKSYSDKIKLVSGGFTAGYFGEDLLEKCQPLDYIIKGDPEKPLEMLLGGYELREIPNLIYKTPSGTASNRVSYFIDEHTISDISFGGLSYLFDYDLYIRAIDKKLGFPIFIGRGCMFNCTYCGGSNVAFRMHSKRKKPVVRSIESVVADLKRLKEFTRKIYICYENNRSYIKSLFEAIRKETTLIKTFQLNYGAWQLFDKEFLELYKDTFISPQKNRPVLELSPEVFDDRCRGIIKHKKVTFSINDLKENLRLINNHLGDEVSVSVFFSRYHDTHLTYTDKKKEITGIFRLKHELFRENIKNAKIFYDHLSTDVASRYWQKYVENPHDFYTLVSAIGKLRARQEHSYHANNLCIYIPDTLSEDEIFRCELLIFILKNLEKYSHEMFHIAFECLGDRIIDVAEEIITDKYSGKPGNVFTSLDHAELIDFIKQKIMGTDYLSSGIPFIKDLSLFCIKKTTCRKGRQTFKSRYQTKRPELNQKFISVHDYDYPDLPRFLQRLHREGAADLRTEKTVFIFLADEILSMTYETYCATLKEFDKGISPDEYYRTMEKKGIFTLQYHRNLIEKLFQSGVLC